MYVNTYLIKQNVIIVVFSLCHFFYTFIINDMVLELLATLWV